MNWSRWFGKQFRGRKRKHDGRDRTIQVGAAVVLFLGAMLGHAGDARATPPAAVAQR